MNIIFRGILLFLTITLFFLICSPNAFAQEQILHSELDKDYIVQSAAVTLDGFSDVTVLSGLNQPTAFRFASDGRVFIAEKSGIIKVFDDLSDTTPTIFADLRAQVYDYWDRGLLGIELHPNFPNTPYVYALYTWDRTLDGTSSYNDTCGDPTGEGCPALSRLVKLTASGDTMTNQQVLITNWCTQYPSHTIGTLKFASDGSLYAGGGDGASFTFIDYGQVGNPCGDPLLEGGSLRSQDIRTISDTLGFNGSIIRVDENGNPLSTNPLYGGDPKDDAVIAAGLRNPFRFTLKPNTNELLIGDVGQGGAEEINRVPNTLGSTIPNFGWPCYEGFIPNTGFQALDLPICVGLYQEDSAVLPYYSYLHQGMSTSISGIEYYTQGSYPSLYDNSIFFADYSQQFIKVMLFGIPDPINIIDVARDGVFPVDLQRGPNGDIFYTDVVFGELHRIVYEAGNRAPTAKITSDKTYGPGPLEVQFNGSESTDPDGDSLSYEWDLDGDNQYDDSTIVNPTRTYNGNTNVTVRLRVKDSAENEDTESIVISPNNQPPTVNIVSPTSSTTWNVGDTISFSGNATDPNTPTLPNSAYRWQTFMHHCVDGNPTDCHVHPLEEFNGVKNGSFLTPDHENPSFIELKLTVTDARGLLSTSSVLLQPNITEVTFSSNIPTAQIALYDAIRDLPFTRGIITNGKTTVTAISPIVYNDEEYRFSSWSDGGARSHEITATGSSMNLTATYTKYTDVTWNSQGMVTQNGIPQGYLTDNKGGNQASMEFYVSSNVGGVDKTVNFTTFNQGIHPDGTNRAKDYWANESGVSYTYVGKSTVGRGYDIGEENPPQPINVEDVQMHPANDGRLTVASFIVPFDGNYRLSNLAARRVDSNLGQSSSFKIFDKDKQLLRTIQATSRSWTTSPDAIELGELQEGDRIYFAVDADGGYWWDQTEVSWSITTTPTQSQNEEVYLTTNIPGLKLIVDSETVSGPMEVSEGETYSLYAPTIQTTTDGKTVRFTSWSNGGAQKQTFTARSNNLTAFYTELPSQAPSFSNGFEEGDTSVYPQDNIDIATGNTLEVKTTNPHSGQYNLEVTSDGTGEVTEAVIDWVTPVMNTIYLQTHFSLESAQITDNKMMNIIAIKNQGYRRLLYVSVGSDYKLRLYKFNPEDVGYCEPDLCGIGELLGVFGPEIQRDGTWHDIQLRYTVDEEHGIIELWLDGDRIAELYEQNTGTAGVDDINVITWGSFYSSHNITSNARFDDFALNTTFNPAQIPTPVNEKIWNSYDVVTQSGSPKATVLSEDEELPADLQLYKSTGNTSVDVEGEFTTFNPGVHPDGTNKVERYWANESGVSYTYVGKSTVGRGSDVNETNASEPSGVNDMQVHPPNDGKLVVAAFTIPEDGNYELSELGTRRIDGNLGQTSTFKIFGKDKNLIASLVADSTTWKKDSNTYDLSNLREGDKIYFAVDADGGYWWDYTEISWRIKQLDTNVDPEEKKMWHSYEFTPNSSGSSGSVVSNFSNTSADLLFYRSVEKTNIDVGSLFSIYNPGVHPDGTNKVERYWANESGVSYTYVGKSTVGRGSDVNETNASEPSGVNDMQVHPPNDNSMTMVSFTFPENGNYSLNDLGVRRVDANTGQTVKYKIYNKDKQLIKELTSTSTSWEKDTETHNLGSVLTGDKIYFAVDADGGYWWDYTEISWTIVKE